MDYVDSDVIDFYRPSCSNGNRLSSSGHNCHSHGQHQISNPHNMQQLNHTPTNVKAVVSHPQVSSAHHALNMNHQQLPRAYQQIRSHGFCQQPANYRHSHQTGSVSTSSTCSSSHKPGTSLRADDLIHFLRDKIAMLPGGRTQTGGPILCFPANSRADEINLEDLYYLVRYLTYLPEESVKKLGFAVIIDMRSGTTWHSVKPILKVRIHVKIC